MSNKSVIVTRVDSIEKLLSAKHYQDIGTHLAYLEAVDMTIDFLQETDVAKAVFQVLKSCPSVLLKNKAKHLLSKWKTLYKNHYHQSIQVQPVESDNEKESSSDHLQMVPQDEKTPEKLNPHEMFNISSSSCLPSEGNLKNTNMQKENEIQLRFLEKFRPVSETSKQQDHMIAVRCKCTELLHEALIDSSTSREENEKYRKIAKEIEQHVFALYDKNDRKYKNCIRSKVSNLKNPKNSHLKHSLCIGTLSPKIFASMSAVEMAHDELKQLRASYTESSVLEHQLPNNVNGTYTNKIKCRRCEKWDCTITVIARGALFLPGWVRNTNPDEQMMTYVICNECGQQWYHSRWICL